MNKLAFKKSILWLLFLTLSLLSSYVAITYFTKAIPLLKIQINSDKNKILKKARKLSAKYGIGPKDFKQSAYFICEHNIQNYIELELNQASSIEDIIEKKLYYPYTWQVRHFQEYNANESVIKFTPEGKFYGFIEHISENEPGSSLSEEEAQAIIKNFLNKETSIDLNEYTLISHSSEHRINGRTDHTFIYQKNLMTPCLKHCLTLSICGNKVTVMNHYIDIPEVFMRKFDQLKSSSEWINTCANMTVYTLYIFLGLLVGLLYLIKKNLLITRPAIMLGFVLAITELFYKLNEIPLSWFYYNTANSLSSHQINYIGGNLTMFIVYIFLYVSTIAVAEGLTRRAFKNHIQFWKILRPSVISTYQTIIQIIVSYLILPIYITFIILFYTFVIKYFGWWSPSTSLINPNILSIYLPGFSVVTYSLRSSIWQECLFRAIPLSFCSIISEEKKYKNVVLFLGLIIQAIIFGSMNTTYLTIPNYIKIIELIIPSFMLGLVYLKWGLLPPILINFTYNTLFLSLPILISKNSNTHIDKLVIILSLMLPLIIVLISKLVSKLRLNNTNPEKIYNGEWQSSRSTSKDLYIDLEKEPAYKHINYKIIYILTTISITLLLAWPSFSQLPNNTKTMQLTRQEAINIAKSFLKKKDINIEDNQKEINTDSNSWSTLTLLENTKEDVLIEKLVLQENSNLYNLLYDLNYLKGLQWIVRFVKFHGTQAEKTEEHIIHISSTKSITRYKHIVFDQISGRYLTQEQAKSLATTFIQDKFKVNISNIVEVSAKDTQKQNRKDWIFIFKDISPEINNKLKDLQPTIVINIAGEEIVDAYKKMNISQIISREEQNQEQIGNIVSAITSTLFLIFMIIALIQFLSLYKMNKFKLSSVNLFFTLYTIILVIKRSLNFPEIISNFSTSKPFYFQLISSEFMYFIYIISSAIGVSLIFGIILSKHHKNYIIPKINQETSQGILLGISLGIIITGITILIEYIIYPSKPVSIISTLNSFYPIALYSLNHIVNYINTTLYLMFIAKLAEYKTNIRSLLIITLSICTIVPIDINIKLDQWLIMISVISIVLFIIYTKIIKYNFSLIPITYACIYQLSLIKSYLISDCSICYFSGLPIVITLILISLCSLILFNFLKSKSNYELKSSNITIPTTIVH
ncbi:CPBP family intramembrane metalloprotease [Candidatus Babela massiliensis]|uniref:CAAX prenyl protease family enzyme n=1 Tax=Candidatus Babela massiliensis TaxID=673862 RepID=V6DJ62_9BACT|nr:CPBP family intramembrane metalloprotease [Candidatus Babela massiliensis]CDK30551.1 CAAX prenyl protease family enzyme [Candidatus Babela massiliensis]